jgi:predicted ATP-dependent endonuclease of OLD family
MESLKIKSLGPIDEANIDFDDLTLLVGPQASGKSLLLQSFKLLIDNQNIKQSLENYSFSWHKNANIFLDSYFGEGMNKIWTKDTKIELNKTKFTKEDIAYKIDKKIVNIAENVFYIPAQRILSIADGRPKNFMEFDASTPYVIKNFSETLRQMLQNGLGKKTTLFPLNNSINNIIASAYNKNIFNNGKIILDESAGQKKIKMDIDNTRIPFIAWSAGQKEFMPLLMSFYKLQRKATSTNNSFYKYVIIEEPEMGLHPNAIQSIILQILDLLSNNYKVIISTHSPIFLEFSWAFNLLKKQKAPNDALLQLFNLNKNSANNKLVNNLLTNKNISTYYFDRNKNNKVVVKNISSLEADNEDKAISDWGGISEFSTTATNIISTYFTEI